MQGKTHKLFDAYSGTGPSATIHTTRIGSKRGVFHLYWVNRPTGTFFLDLEVSPDGENWTTMLTWNRSVPKAATKSFGDAVFHYPFIRANITSNTTAELSVWYIE